MVRLKWVALAGCLAACDRSFDEVDGYKLGRPESVVFARNQSGHMMFVMSNLSNLCDTLASADPPALDDYWVLSNWTRLEVDAPGEYATEAFVAVSNNSVIDEYDTEVGELKIKRLGVDKVKAIIDLTFPGGDRVKARVTADLCDEDLFAGMY